MFEIFLVKYLDNFILEERSYQWKKSMPVWLANSICTELRWFVSRQAWENALKPFFTVTVVLWKLSRCVFVFYFTRQCSECDPSDDEDEMEVDPEDTTPISQGRQRRIIKEPSKFTPDKGEVGRGFLQLRPTRVSWVIGNRNSEFWNSVFVG